jgi:hypothetical protein
MLGQDDWFEKTTAEGRDYIRFDYMRRLLAFNEAGRRALLAEGETVRRPARRATASA